MDRLLIVDDEDIEREGIASLIDWEQHGIKMVGTAWNGIDGLEQMERLRPNIVLVDIKMPGMNGLEMIHQARPLYPDTVFIILSGYGEYEFTSQAMEEGIRHYILKPCDEEKITIYTNSIRLFVGLLPRSVAAAAVQTVYWGGFLLLLSRSVPALVATGFWLPCLISLKILAEPMERHLCGDNHSES